MHLSTHLVSQHAWQPSSRLLRYLAYLMVYLMGLINFQRKASEPNQSEDIEAIGQKNNSNVVSFLLTFMNRPHSHSSCRRPTKFRVPHVGALQTVILWWSRQTWTGTKISTTSYEAFRAFFNSILMLHVRASHFSGASISTITGGTYLNILGNYVIEAKYMGE